MRIAIAIAAVIAACGGGSTYTDPAKCNVADPDAKRLATCMANRPPWYCGGSGNPNPHAFQYGDKSDHICTKAELDRAGIAPEVRPTSQR